MRSIVGAGALVLMAAAGLGQPGGRTPRSQSPASFSVVDASITDLRTALEQGRTTSHALVSAYLARIAYYGTVLHPALAVSRAALADADERDAERRAGRVRGPLHGIPIALKDNVHTTTMPTTGGALAFAGFTPPYEATLTTRLRDAGAIIIAKTTMTELANWVAGAPTPMPANYNAITGFGFNPYDPRRDPRATPGDGRPVMPTGGSSSGIGTAASLWAANVGTETSGSILSPSNQTMLVGIKPTVGRISRHGIIPITADQDTAGPMARTVTDAAILLGVLESPTRDPNDAATGRCTPPAGGDYTRFLRAGGLKGARIGIPRAYYYEPGPVTALPRGGLEARQVAAMAEAMAVLRAHGAELVDPANLPSIVAADRQRNVLAWTSCAGRGEGRGGDAGCSSVLKYGMKRDFNAWLRSLGPSAPVPTLTALREWNEAHRAAGAIRYGQAALDVSDEIDLERDRAKYDADRARDLQLTATDGLDAVIRRERLDAVLFPGGSGASIAARPGYPSVIVPFAMVPNAPSPPLPAAFDAQPQPYGVTFTGLACSEARLIELAYAFEQATRRRIPPPGLP